MDLKNEEEIEGMNQRVTEEIVETRKEIKGAGQYAPKISKNAHLKLSCGCAAWGVFKISEKFKDGI